MCRPLRPTVSGLGAAPALGTVLSSGQALVPTTASCSTADLFPITEAHTGAAVGFVTISSPARPVRNRADPFGQIRPRTTDFDMFDSVLGRLAKFAHVFSVFLNFCDFDA